MIELFFFVLGCVVGSFLNVMALRGEKGKTLLGRSQCLHCKKKLVWYELVPLFSFIFQKGKCRKCRAHLSLQYPLVEVGTGLLFLALFSVYAGGFALRPLLAFFATLLVGCVLVVILVRDFRTKIIPDAYNSAFALLALLVSLLKSESIFSQETFLLLLAGPLLFLPFYLLWHFSRGRAIGLGDGKFAWGVGWFLGLPLGLSGILYGFWIGALVSLVLLLVQHLKKGNGLTLKSEIPFAPFLVAGVLVAYFSHYTVLDTFSFLLFL